MNTSLLVVSTSRTFLCASIVVVSSLALGGCAGADGASVGDEEGISSEEAIQGVRRPTESEKRAITAEVRRGLVGNSSHLSVKLAPLRHLRVASGWAYASGIPRFYYDGQATFGDGSFYALMHRSGGRWHRVELVQGSDTPPVAKWVTKHHLPKGLVPANDP